VHAMDGWTRDFLRAAGDRVPVKIMCIQGPDTHGRELLACSVRLYYSVLVTGYLELRSLTQHRTAVGVTDRLRVYVSHGTFFTKGKAFGTWVI
jgi:hypothetical protein